MKKDLRLMLLLPFAIAGDLLLSFVEAIDTRLANSLNTPEDEL